MAESDPTGPERQDDLDAIVVGGGPGGMVLAHLLARAGQQVVLLEGHADFDRDFRGDSLHPYTLELLDTLGLADDLLALPHFKATRFRAHTTAGTIVLADYEKVRSSYPYVVIMPQVRFLDFLAERSHALPGFTLLTGARVRELVVEDGRVVGVRWRDGRQTRELRARVVVACDGRFSKLRSLPRYRSPTSAPAATCSGSGCRGSRTTPPRRTSTSTSDRAATSGCSAGCRIGSSLHAAEGRLSRRA